MPPPESPFTVPPAARATVAPGDTATPSAVPADVAASRPSAATSEPFVSFVSNALAPVLASAPSASSVPRQEETPFVGATVSTVSGASVPVPATASTDISGVSHASGSACSVPSGIRT